MAQNRRAGTSLPACALMTALLAVCALVSIPLPGVPLNLALFAVHLGAMLLGPSRAALAALAYLVLGAFGIPVFAGFASGPAALFGPTGGFLLSYPLCALAVGALARRAGSAFFHLLASALVGAALCTVCGALWFVCSAGITPSPAAFAYWLLFLPGDAAKAALAAALFIRLQKPLRAMGLS